MTKQYECTNLLLLFFFSFFFQAEDKLALAAQALKEVCALFDEDYSSSSWEESTVENFLNVVSKQADELHSCVSSLSVPPLS